MEKPINYCPAPWHGGYFTQEGCAVCCILPVENVSPQELLSSSTTKEIRQGLISNNLDPACSKCVEREQHGFNGMRVNHIKCADEFNTTHSYDVDSELVPQIVEVRFTNVCNFKCRMCYPILSSLIAKEINDNSEIINWYGDKKHKLVESGVGTKFFDEIVANSKHFKRLYLTGGEPTVSKAVTDYMKTIVDAGYAKNMTLVFSTNAGAINPLFNDLLPEFKRVEILLSLDAIGEIAEYQRHGASWDRVDKNVQHYRKLANSNQTKYSIGTHSVITAYSVLGIDGLFQYLSDNNIGGAMSICYDDFYKIQALKGPLRKSAIESAQRAVDIARRSEMLHVTVLESLVTFLREQPELDSDWEIFYKRTKALDQVRNESFEKVFDFALSAK